MPHRELKWEIRGEGTKTKNEKGLIKTLHYAFIGGGDAECSS